MFAHYYKEQNLTAITGAVIVCHLLLLLFALFWTGSAYTAKNKIQQKRLYVKTVNLNTSSSSRSTTKKQQHIEKKTTQTTSKEEKRPIVKAKKTEKKQVIPKERTKTTKPKATTSKTKQKELIADAQKSIDQISKARDKLKASSEKTAPTLKKIENLQIETFTSESGHSLSSQEESYYDELASRLKMLLRLPEYGEVKIKLTINRIGKFVKLAVVNSKSPVNRNYIEKTIPSLKFPAFENNFPGKEEFTFILAMSNE